MSTGSSAEVTRRGFLPRMRDTRIRSKLALILFVPLAAVVVLAGIRLYDVGQRANEAAEVDRLAQLGTAVTALTEALHDERIVAAGYLADRNASADAYNQAGATTDAKIQIYRVKRGELADPVPAIAAMLDGVDGQLSSLTGLRDQIGKRENIAVAQSAQLYGGVLGSLLGYGQAVSQFAGDGPAANSTRAVGTFGLAKSNLADEESMAYVAQLANDRSLEQRIAFIGAQTTQQGAYRAFDIFSDAAQKQLVKSLVTSDRSAAVEQVSARIIRGEAVRPADVTGAFGALGDVMRQAEEQLEVGNLAVTKRESDKATQRAWIESGIVLAVLLLAVLLAVLLARSLNVSLRKLREGALSVANRDLPEAVAKLRDSRSLGDGTNEELLRSLSNPIDLDGRDEVGQVAQAFNVVQREAVRIAAEQAALQTSVSAMFLNLARRSQSLVDRMIGELDSIERTEEDPKRLARLFELDHLATRMRRNDENLLVLAGADTSPPRREDALLVDALRASQSEVELYNRVEFGTVDTDIAIQALAVNDVVRLVAELLDNATRFSPPHTIVVADARRIRDYVVVQVEDHGLGMSEEQMDTLNRRLAEPTAVDVASFRLMGLAVVSRLAARFNIKVELRANIDGGTIAQVTLPSDIVVLPARRVESGPDGEPAELETGSWDSMSVSRAETATLPAIGSGAWTDRSAAPSGNPAFDRSVPFDPHPSYDPGPAYDRPGAAEPEWEPGSGSREPITVPEMPRTQQQQQGGHPSLPMFPSQRPPSTVETDLQPTPNRPPLPTRGVKPITAGGAPAGPAAVPPAVPPVPAMPAASVAPPPAPPMAPPRNPDAGHFALPAFDQNAFDRPAGRPSSDRPSFDQPAFDQPAFDRSAFDRTEVDRAAPDSNGWGAALAAMPPVPEAPRAEPEVDRNDSPIFVQMQQSWFRNHDSAGTEEWGMPTAGYAPPPNAAVIQPTVVQPTIPAQAAERQAARAAATAPAGPQQQQQRPVPQSSTTSSTSADASSGENMHNGASPAVPRPRGAAEERWQTAADDGWKRAMAAAEPADAGTTRSGLPKRKPQAQLVPGGVQPGPRNQNKRNPDEVRGLLSAYHRGVQRGRNDGTAESDAHQGKENDQ